MVQNNSKYILDYIVIATLIKVFRINIAISLNVSWNNNLHDDPLFLSHFWLIYIHIFHFGKYQELFNSRSKMAHLPLSGAGVHHCMLKGGTNYSWTVIMKGCAGLYG